jgi:hypothetical protein
MFVICSECDEQHSPDDVEFVNIEEDFQGRDVITFVCPETGNEAKSNVYGR